MEGLAKRSSPIAIPKTPEELEVNVRQVSGGRLQGNFSIVTPETSVAYDIAGNAIECNKADILEKKLTPSPIAPRRQVEKEMIWTDDHLRKTRSGLTYGA